MALHGDLFSYPLPELLQWLDSSRKTGTLQLLSWEAGERKLFLLSGQVVAVANKSLWGRVARVLSLAKLAEGAEVPGNQVFQGVDKGGLEMEGEPPMIRGDTVGVLNRIQVPLIVGIGDIGKMGHFDDVRQGAPVTRKAVELILANAGGSGWGSRGRRIFFGRSI